MKKLSMGILLSLMILLLTACDDKVVVTNENASTTQSAQKKAETKKEETDKNSAGEEFVPIPNQVTDEVELVGMTEDILDSMTLEEKIGQLFVVNLELLDHSKGDFYEHRKSTQTMIDNLKKYNVGGITLFSRNIEKRAQTKQLISDLQGASLIPLYVTVDEEGGEVSRIASNTNMKTTMFPTMEVVGASKDASYAKEIGSTIGEEIRQLGFNVDFAPVADVKTNELNTEIGSRAFGAEPSLVSKMVTNVVKGLQSQGVSATLKHFPGQGNTDGDSHDGAVNLENDLDHFREVEAAPFEEGIKAGADFVMVSHVSISKVTEDSVPASLSSVVITDMLRKELGFNGVVITDAMNMKSITNYYNSSQAAVMALKAGADIILMPDNFEEAYNGILQAVQNGEISQSKIDDAVKRILTVKIKRGMLTAESPIIERIQ
ncbi:beta-hexosaminidase [Lachnospiraceae bacterium KM106-2]|nr:beta-hexosaminidase [Lachnospiraceae bacterium KM106-2]